MNSTVPFMKPVHRNRRLALVGIGAALLCGAAFLVFTALKQNVAYFYTPSEIATAKIVPGTLIRLGGMVEEGSIDYAPDGSVSFKVIDGTSTMHVNYSGILPDLFSEGRGVIAQGRFTDTQPFIATTILAKHDENYVPRELKDVLE